jgi:adhesin transport system membrane fusion protein
MNSEFKKIASETNKAGDQSSSLLLLIIVCLISAILYWAAVTELDKVIRGDGKTVSDLENQLIQTSESGVLIKRYFEEGDFVSRGDILFDIDPIDARTEYEQAVEKSIRLQIQQHRLISESKNVEPNFKKFESNNLKVFIQNQVDLYYAKKTDLKQNILILEQRSIQRVKQIEELKGEASSAEIIGTLLLKEIETLEPLVKAGLSPETNLLTLLRQQEENLSISEASLLKIDRLKAELIEIEEQKNAEKQKFKTAALSEVSSINEELRELNLVIPSLSARLARNSIYSTVDGIINQINFQTEDAYIRSGEVLVEIVPTGEDLIVEARIDPKDIADVVVGDRVKISLTAYDPTRYGRLDGTVTKISADALQDKQDGKTFYAVEISIDSKLFEKGNKEVVLLPGMVATIDILAGKRTVLDYVWQPIARSKDRALRD